MSYDDPKAAADAARLMLAAFAPDELSAELATLVAIQVDPAAGL